MRNNAKFESKIVLRYTLLQIPGIVLLISILLLVQNWVYLPIWLILLITFLWILKDSILFFFVWPAYDWNKSASERYSIIGKIGVARETLYTTGYVSINGELWNAEHISGKGLIRAGEKVRVIQQDGLKVFVESAEEDE